MEWLVKPEIFGGKCGLFASLGGAGKQFFEAL